MNTLWKNQYNVFFKNKGNNRSIARYLLIPYFCLAYRAAMATLLNTQKPLAALRMLWCPGGLSTGTKDSFQTNPSRFAWKYIKSKKGRKKSTKRR